MKSTYDILVSELCEEIDELKQSNLHWKRLYENERDERNKELNQRLIDSQKGVANALMFCVAVKDNPDGSLSIGKDERKHLAESIK